MPLVLALLIGLAIALGWLVGRSDGMGGPPLVVLWGGDPEVFDPQQTSHPVAQDIFRHVCEPLFYEDDTGRLRGLLAEDTLDYSEGGRRLTVRLRPGIIFHDGAMMDAQAVQGSFERLLHLGGSPLQNDLRDVAVAAQADGRSVVFTLPEPDYEFARLVLSNSYAAVVSPRTPNGGGSTFVDCTGPYQFVPSLYHAGRTITLMRNPTYHWPPALFDNRNAAHIPQIRFDFIAEREGRLDALLNGEGCVLSLSSRHVEQVAALPRFRLYDAMGGVTYLGFNFQRPRWQNLQVRQAIAQAVDKTSLAQTGPFLVANTPLTPNTTGYDPDVGDFSYSHDPKRSRTLLAQSGFERDSEIVLLIPESNTYRELAAALQEQLRAVGLDQVQIKEVSRADILTQRQDFDLLLFDYAWGDYTALAIFLGSGPRNLLSYPHGDVTEMVQQARTAATSDLRRQYVNQAQQVILEQAIWQPLLIRRITFAVDGLCVQGERQSSYGELLFHDGDTSLARY
ncbi:MAG: ABC transporter substrate-binding protein [Chloroflexi bacterium]|nr:ABC transporter substrate-binding protein [Chloroflexota bacterium]